MSHHGIITELKSWLSQQIIGQERLLDRLLIALLADGHLLVEGAPGLAKTKAIKDLSRAVEGTFIVFNLLQIFYLVISLAQRSFGQKTAPFVFNRAPSSTTLY